MEEHVMNLLESIIYHRMPLSDFQQLALDCRITSENNIKAKCINSESNLLNHIRYADELFNQFKKKENPYKLNSYIEIVDKIKEDLSKYKTFFDGKITYSLNDDITITISNTNSGIVVPYMYFARTISDNGVYVYDCCYESPHTVIYHIKKYDKNEHITLDMLKYKKYE